MASIIIPAYKERKCLEKLIPEVFSFVSHQENEVIVVNDESGDGTYEYLKGVKTCYPVNFINRDRRYGLTSAILDGISLASHEDIIVMDADGQHPPRFLPKFLTELKTHNLVVGTRYFMFDSGVPGFNTVRIFGSLFCNLIAWPLTGLRDSTSGFFGFKKSKCEVSEIFAYSDPSSFKTGFEFFIRMKENRKEIGYSFEDRYFGVTKMSTSQVTLYFKQVFNAYVRKFDLQRMSKFFIVGALGVIVNYAVLLPLVEVFGVDYRIANFAAISSAALFNFKLNAAWTFRSSRNSSNTLSSTVVSPRINMAQRLLRQLKLSNRSKVSEIKSP